MKKCAERLRGQNMEEFFQNKKIMLFDGDCGLCDTTVQKIIAKDKKDVLRFASLQSKIGQKLLLDRGIDTNTIDSIILIDPGVAYYQKSAAAFEISKHLQGSYSLISYFSALPIGFTDFVYDYVAKNRYKWFGKKEDCLLPSDEYKNKFLDLRKVEVGDL